MRKLIIFALSQLLFLAACGGSSSDALSTSSTGTGTGTGTTGTGTTGTGPTSGTQTIATVNNTNAVAMEVNAGPAGGQANIPYVTVTICAPGSTTNCVAIPNVEVDTGSYGVRIIASVLANASSTVYNALTPETVTNSGITGNLFECTMFADGFSWGSMATADVVIGTERAAGQSVELMGDETDNIPSNCANTGSEEDTVALFGANGIIGVGPFVTDCDGCSGNPANAGNGFYWSCPAGGGTCTGTEVASTSQEASNPVASFTTDNQGVILELPAIPDAGAATAAGTLVFGIGTQSNNALGSVTVFGTDDEADFNINYKNQLYSEAFMDSGSNIYFFNDSSITECTSGSGSTETAVYCPSSELTETALVEGASGNPQASVTFFVTNAETANGAFTAFDNVAAPFTPTETTTSQFDLGLPFFYGRNVFIAIAGQNTSGGTGPYVAF